MEDSEKKEGGFPKKPLDFISSIRRQIDRCLLYALDEEAFATNVKLLLQMLPEEIKESEEFKQRAEQCVQKFYNWQYKYCGKHPMGTPDNPVRDAEGRVLSPILVEEEYTDWVGLFQLALEMLDRMGILYERKPRVREVWK